MYTPSREQQLVDLIFNVAMVARDRSDWFAESSRETVAGWVAYNLRGCGFYTVPMGSSWGVLRDEPKDTQNGIEIVEAERP